MRHLRSVAIIAAVFFGLYWLGEYRRQEPATASATDPVIAKEKAAELEKRRIELEQTMPELLARKVRISDYRWRLSGAVAMVRPTYVNQNDVTIKDIQTRCDFYSKSRTRISTSVRTVYILISPGNTLRADEINFGFVDPQSASIVCNVEAASRG